jgi:N-acetylglucosaminyl-diphospho-decaprenol L-rhamnosyltransferase
MNDTSRQRGVSICIVNWNGRELLRRLLESIRAHGAGMTVQVIVVDNASADGSVEMVAGEYPEVELVRNSVNRGFAAGNNQAAERAVHPLLFFLNNDTALRAGALERLVEAVGGERQGDKETRGQGGQGDNGGGQGAGAEILRLRDASRRAQDDSGGGDVSRRCSEGSRVVAVGPRLIGSDGRPQQTVRRLPTLGALLHRIMWLRWTGLFKRSYCRYRMGDFDAGRSGEVGQLDAAALLVRREAFERAGRWDERFPFGVEDVDLCARLGPLGGIRYVAEAEVDHSGRVSSRANRPFVYRGYELGYARYVGKHFGGGAAVGYKLLVTLDMPLRVLLLAGQFAAHRIARGAAGAERARERLIAAGHFLFHGLPGLWRA